MDKRISFRQGRTRDSKKTQFWIRCLAFIVDFLVIRWILLPMLLLGASSLFRLVHSEFLFDLNLSYFNEDMMSSFILSWALVLTVFILYSSILESSKLKATFGKWFMRLQLYDLRLNKISFMRALIRNILKIISIVSIIGVGIIDITNRQQGLHDLIAGTIIKRR